VPKAASGWLSKAGCFSGRTGCVFGLSAVRRLQTRPQFQTVLSGAVIAKSPHFALHCRDLSSFEAQAPTTAPHAGASVIGALIPKRWAKRAVTRNAIKRQIFQVVQEFDSVLTGCAFVVRLRHTFDRTQFVSASSVALKDAVRHELIGLFTVASSRIPGSSHA